MPFYIVILDGVSLLGIGLTFFKSSEFWKVEIRVHMVSEISNIRAVIRYSRRFAHVAGAAPGSLLAQHLRSFLYSPLFVFLRL